MVMAITDIPVLSMLRTRLQWAQQRQSVLAENVVNADTPNFRGRDLAPLKFETPAAVNATTVSSVTLVRTENGHLAGIGRRIRRTAPRAETITKFARPATPSISSRR
jgi:flagellar basal-body rod protein FlgB